MVSNTDNQEIIHNFMEHMNRDNEVSRAFNEASNDDRGFVRDPARETIFKIGYERGDEEGLIEDGVNSPEELAATENGYAIAQKYAKMDAGIARQQASESFSQNLETIIEGVPENGLDAIITNETIQKSALSSEKHAKWAGIYSQYVKAQQDVEIAEEDPEALDKETRQSLLKLYAKRAGQEKREEIREKGYHSDLQDTAVELAETVVLIGGRKVDYKGLTKEKLEIVEKALREYERESEVDKRAYAVHGIKELSKRGTDGFNQARKLAYSSYRVAEQLASAA